MLNKEGTAKNMFAVDDESGRLVGWLVYSYADPNALSVMCLRRWLQFSWWLLLDGTAAAGGPGSLGSTQSY